MMKKLGIFAFVMALVVAFALPAYSVTVTGEKDSSVNIGGLFVLDANWKGVDKNFQTYVNVPTGGGMDKTMFIMDAPWWNVLWLKLKVGNFTAFGDFATTVSFENSNLQVNSTTYQNYIDDVIGDRFYGGYQFGNCYFEVGKNDNWLISSEYGVAPSSVLGYSAANTTHVALIGWGWMYDGKNANIRFRQNVTKMFGYQIALVNNGTYAETVGTATRLSYGQYPVIAAKLLLNFGPVALYPGAAYSHVQWDALSPGYQDNMTAYSAILPIRVAVGPFVAAMQFGYGQNVGGVTSGNVLMRGENSSTGYLRDANHQIVNTTDITAFVDLSVVFGPVKPHIFFGYDNASNDLWKVAGNDYYTRMSYGINLYYTIGNLQIIPEIAFYDYGTMAGVASKPDLGKEWLGGVQFRFAF